MPLDKKGLKERDERRRNVARLMVNHATMAEMESQLGMSHSTLANDMRWVRAQWQKDFEADMEQLKAREFAELADMERTCVREFVQSHEGNWIDRRLKVKERKSKMMGLDSPQKNEHSGPAGSPIAIEGMDMASLMANPEARLLLEKLNVLLESVDSNAGS